MRSIEQRRRLQRACVGALVVVMGAYACSDDVPPRRGVVANDDATIESGPKPCRRGRVDSGIADSAASAAEVGAPDAEPTDAGGKDAGGLKDAGGIKDGGDSGISPPKDAGTTVADADLPDASVADADLPIDEDCDDAATLTRMEGEVNVITGERTPGDSTTGYRRLETSFRLPTTRNDCTTQTFETCEVLICTKNIDAGLPTLSATVPNVGRLDINAPLGSFSNVLPLTNGTYPLLDTSGSVLWSASGAVRFLAKGSNSGPAFDKSVPVPVKMALSEPVLPTDETPLVMSPAAPLQITWDAIVGQTTIEVLVKTVDDRRRLRCEFPSGPARTAKVPALALAKLAGLTGSVTISSMNADSIAQVDASIKLSAKMLAVQGSRLAQFNASFE